MTVSELIKELQELQDSFGSEHEVVLDMSRFKDENVNYYLKYCIESIKQGTLFSYSTKKIDNVVNLVVQNKDFRS